MIPAHVAEVFVNDLWRVLRHVTRDKDFEETPEVYHMVVEATKLTTAEGVAAMDELVELVLWVTENRPECAGVFAAAKRLQRKPERGLPPGRM